jgi:hypothetical protein
MDNFNIIHIHIHIIYLGIIFLILLINHKKKKIKEQILTIEYYEWKRLYFKMLVLYKIKKKIKHKHFDKKKWIDSIINKSVFF